MTALEARLQLLRERFVERAAADADAIEAAAAAMDWPAVRDLSHGIVGRAGMFGFPALSDAARILETAVDAREPAERLGALSAALVSRLRGVRINDGSAGQTNSVLSTPASELTPTSDIA